MMITSKTIFAAVVLAISCFITANILIETQPINILVRDGTPITIHTPLVYGEIEVITMIIASWTAGISAMYLYSQASKKTYTGFESHMIMQNTLQHPQRLGDLETVTTALKVLREPGRKILEIIVNKGGEILQKDLCLETNFSKAKTSRTLRELEGRNIIQRRQYGGTKMITISDWMKKGTPLNQEKSAT